MRRCEFGKAKKAFRSLRAGAVIAVFATKWKPVLLFHLFDNGTLRHGELRRLLPDISQRILTQQLRELERDGLVTREQFQVVPPKVEYSATKLAWTVKQSLSR